MKLARTGLIAAAILAVSTAAFAQKPDFSGTWTPEAPAAAAAPATPPAGGGGGGRGMGMAAPMTVKQTATEITTEVTRGETKVVTVYKLDGTESVNKVSMGRGENATVVEAKSTAKWDGAKLVISTTRPGQDGTPMTSAQTWSLDGGNLVIERPGRGEGAPVQKTIYKKTT